MSPPAWKDSASKRDDPLHGAILVGRPEVLLTSYVRHLDLRLVLGRCLGRAKLGIAVGAPRPDVAERRLELLVGRPTAERSAEVVAAGCEQARVEASLGREA